MKIGPKPGLRGVNKSGPVGPGLKCRALIDTDTAHQMMLCYNHPLHTAPVKHKPAVGHKQPQTSVRFHLSVCCEKPNTSFTLYTY